MKAVESLDHNLERFCCVLDVALKWFAFSLVIGLTISTLTEVLIRYLLPVPPRWAGGEVPSVLLVWLTAVGIVIAVRRAAHLRLDIFSIILNPRNAAALQVCVDIASLCFMVLFAWLAYEYAADNLRTQMPGLGVSYGWVNAAFVFGATFAAIYFIKQITGGIRITLFADGTQEGRGS